MREERRMRAHVFLVYTVALSLFIASASISAPPNPAETFDTHVQLCDALAQKMPCEHAGGTLIHVCRASVAITCSATSNAIQASRHMPVHICSFVSAFQGGTCNTNEMHMSNIVKAVGVVMGISLMLLGKVLYKPCLFFMPAMIMGCAMIQPLVPQLKEWGMAHVHASALGSLIGFLLALLQRHVMVWLLGVLIGIMWFVSALVFTPLLSDFPPEALLLIGILFALTGSSVVMHVERTSLWKVTACALVGSLLFTDAIGVRHVWKPLQVWVCALLAAYSSWQQLRRRNDATPQKQNVPVVRGEKEPKTATASKEPSADKVETVPGQGSGGSSKKSGIGARIVSLLARLCWSGCVIVWRAAGLGGTESGESGKVKVE